MGELSRCRRLMELSVRESDVKEIFDGGYVLNDVETHFVSVIECCVTQLTSDRARQ
jgi:hypothetical protein